MQSKIIILIILLFCGRSTFSGYRIWEDKNGRVVEAELVNVVGNRVALRMRGGKKIVMDKKELSEKDQDYLGWALPPGLRVKIKVQDTVFSEQQLIVRCNLEIDKLDVEPYSGSILVRLYAIGHDWGTPKTLTVIDCQEWRYPFLKDGRFTMNQRYAKSFDIQQIKRNGRTFPSVDFKGILVTVEDAMGKIVVKTSSPSNLARKLDELNISLEVDQK